MVSFYKNLSILYMDKEVEKVFTPRPMVSFLSAWKLISYLIRAKLYHLERTVGSCQVCNCITEADSFTCSNDQLSFKINHRFDCNEKCLIYLIMCNRCLKQYVCQTVAEFRHRTVIRITQESLKEENTACKDTCMSILIYQVTQGF